MEKITCRGGKIRFRLGKEIKEYYATDIEVVGTANEVQVDTVAEKKPKKKRKPKKTVIKTPVVDMDIQKGGEKNDNITRD